MVSDSFDPCTAKIVKSTVNTTCVTKNTFERLQMIGHAIDIATVIWRLFILIPIIQIAYNIARILHDNRKLTLKTIAITVVLTVVLFVVSFVTLMYVYDYLFSHRTSWNIFGTMNINLP